MEIKVIFLKIINKKRKLFLLFLYKITKINNKYLLAIGFKYFYIS